MGKLKKSVFTILNREDELKDFKIGLQNRIDHKRVSIENEHNDLERKYGEIPEYVYAAVYEFPAALAIDILSELGIESDKLNFKISTEYIDQYDVGSYSFVDFNEIWNFIKALDEKSFLVSMLIISSSNSNWESISSIQQLIIKELNNFKFEIDYKKSTVFIAMSFSESMNKTRKSIIKVIEEFGYEAMLIDIKEHNNQIVPEIFSEIENADFVVSDLTEQKRGVYLETGYAMAKEKQVILTCKTDDFDKNHFDVSQINTIIWSDENELEIRLRARIKAMHSLIK
ncbi:hypothetical protein ACFVAD_01570 [Sutcliffiella sp. NPDC057660]|uniref:hypothetical protein n=1 Tax=Sutcliffiella sp. NPDC057660 TaxID=3346199 RepID=UPI003698ED87